jgi:hypothetical protein
MRTLKYKVIAIKSLSRNETDKLLKVFFDNSNSNIQEIIINLALGNSVDFRLLREEDIRNALSTTLVYQSENGDLRMPSVVREQIVRGYSDRCLSKAISEQNKNIEYLSNNKKIFEMLAAAIFEGNPIPFEYQGEIFSAGLVNVLRNGDMEISQAVIDAVKELVINNIYAEDVRLGNGDQIDTDFLKTPHYGPWHTEGGLSATLSSHIYKMFSAVGKVKQGEHPLPDFLQKVFDKISREKWEAYVLIHDYGKKKALKTKENGIDHSFHWHEEYSFDFVMHTKPTYKGVELDDVSKTVIKFHGFPLYLSDSYRKMISHGENEAEIIKQLSPDLKNMIEDARKVWQNISSRDDFDEQGFVDMLIGAICLDCLGQAPLGKETADVNAAILVYKIYQNIVNGANH